MKPSELIAGALPAGSPLVGMLIGKHIAKIDENETALQLMTMVDMLAGQDDMNPVDFVRSGRALVVLSSLVTGNQPPSRQIGATLEMTKCPKCKHVQYAVTKEV